ncbi:unnamed protein product, partial [Ectocarpus sp. 12 AP-2014]
LLRFPAPPRGVVGLGGGGCRSGGGSSRRSSSSGSRSRRGLGGSSGTHRRPNTRRPRLQAPGSSLRGFGVGRYCTDGRGRGTSNGRRRRIKPDSSAQSFLALAPHARDLSRSRDNLHRGSPAPLAFPLISLQRRRCCRLLRRILLQSRRLNRGGKSGRSRTTIGTSTDGGSASSSGGRNPIK